MSLIGSGVLKINGYSYPVFIESMETSFPDNRTEFSGSLVGIGEPDCCKPSKAFFDLFKSPDPSIKKVIFNDPATVVMWSDGTKTVVKCQPGDTYSKETGLALCIAKKYLGNKGNFNEVFKQWIPEDKISVDEMREALVGYCYLRHCRNCLVDKHIPDHRCRNGTLFGVKKPTGSYDMTDDEVRAAYNVAFKED